MTVNQRNFARYAAQGRALVEAHDLAYGKGNSTRKTKHENASKLAKRPEVQAAIAEFEEQLAPITDLRAVREEMLRNIRTLAQASPDQRVRLAASIHLQQYADQREKLEETRRLRQGALTIDGLIHEIRQLDAPEPTVELEAVEEAAAPPVQGGEEPS
jgi:hypothetical protein